MFLNSLILLIKSSFPLHVQVGLCEGDDTSELLVVVLLVQVHAVGQHALQVAQFD